MYGASQLSRPLRIETRVEWGQITISMPDHSDLGAADVRFDLKYRYAIKRVDI